MDDAAIRARILALLAARPASASVCPSEVARDIEGDEARWRALMPDVRRVAAVLLEAGVVDVTQGTHRLDAVAVQSARGPVRLRRGPAFDPGA